MRMGYRTIPVIGWDPYDEHIGVERASTHNTFKQYDDLVSFQNQFYVDQVHFQKIRRQEIKFGNKSKLLPVDKTVHGLRIWHLDSQYPPFTSNKL